MARQKQKSSAKQHAQNRAQSQMELADAPRVPRSHKEADQGRFPGETPLSGEDRPLAKRGGKQQGNRGQTVARGRTPDMDRADKTARAPSTKRRGRQSA